MERQFGARLTWLPFDLHPEYPPEGIPRSDLVARYGDGYDARTREMFAAEDLVYAPPAGVSSNTRMALELGEQARAEQVHRAYHDRVMDAYWAEGVDLSQRPALEQLARDAGVYHSRIERALEDRVWAGAVDVPTRRAQAAGATGVPSFVIDWRLLVAWAEPPERLPR